jgi:hypothetical protein
MSRQALTDEQKIASFERTAQRQKEYDVKYYKAKAVLKSKIDKIVTEAGFNEKQLWSEAKSEVGM